MSNVISHDIFQSISERTQCVELREGESIRIGLYAATSGRVYAPVNGQDAYGGVVEVARLSSDYRDGYIPTFDKNDFVRYGYTLA